MDSSGFWSATIRGGESLLLNPGCTLKITNIALGLHLPKPGSRTTLRFEQSAESASTTVLGTFLIGVSEQVQIKCLKLHASQDYTFSAVGPNDLHVAGYFIDDLPDHVKPSKTVARITKTSAKGFKKLTRQASSVVFNRPAIMDRL